MHPIVAFYWKPNNTERLSGSSLSLIQNPFVARCVAMRRCRRVVGEGYTTTFGGFVDFQITHLEPRGGVRAVTIGVSVGSGIFGV